MQGAGADSEFLRVLLVEDSPDILLIERISLELDPAIRVQSCTSGEEAIQLACHRLPDVILLDVMMPGMDGIETLAALRSLPRTREVPVILITAKVLTDEMDRYRILGALGVIPKPFDVDALARTVRDLWQRTGWRGEPADAAAAIAEVSVPDPVAVH